MKISFHHFKAQHPCFITRGHICNGAGRVLEKIYGLVISDFLTLLIKVKDLTNDSLSFANSVQIHRDQIIWAQKILYAFLLT